MRNKRSVVEDLLREAERPDARTLRVLSRLEAASKRYDVSVSKLEEAMRKVKDEELDEESNGEDDPKD